MVSGSAICCFRDAASDALPKAVRADLHERYAAWLERHGAALVELDELVGFHLECACRYCGELGLPAHDQLAETARRRLSAAGRRAIVRQDIGAAVSLLERAVALVPPGAVDVVLEVDLVDALLLAGMGGEALRRAGSLAERASAAGDRVGELCGRIKEGILRYYLMPEVATEKLAALIEQALPALQAEGDDLALYHTYLALAHVASKSGRYDAVLEAFARAFGHARQAGLPYQLSPQRAIARLIGTTPVRELLAWLDEQTARGEPQSLALPTPRAYALAMLGRFDDARALLAEARSDLADRGAKLPFAITISASATVELLAGDPAATLEFAEEAFSRFDELGERSSLFASAGVVAEALYALDRLDEAEAWIRRTAESDSPDDEMVSREVAAKVLARRGEHDEAERLAQEAVAVGEDTDWLNGQGDAHANLAEVLLLVGKPDEATAALKQALTRYQRKGNLVSAQHTQARIDGLRDTALR